MSVTLTSKTRLDALIAAANSKTGGAATDLTIAVQALCDGFGTGGGDGVDLADVDVYVADFYRDEVAVTAGALDVYKRIIVS